MRAGDITIWGIIGTTVAGYLLGGKSHRIMGTGAGAALGMAGFGVPIPFAAPGPLTRWIVDATAPSPGSTNGETDVDTGIENVDTGIENVDTGIENVDTEVESWLTDQAAALAETWASGTGTSTADEQKAAAVWAAKAAKLGLSPCDTVNTGLPEPWRTRLAKCAGNLACEDKIYGVFWRNWPADILCKSLSACRGDRACCQTAYDRYMATSGLPVEISPAERTGLDTGRTGSGTGTAKGWGRGGGW